jgi:hypothetical protein
MESNIIEKRSSKYDKKIQIRLADEDISKLTELAEKKKLQ